MLDVWLLLALVVFFGCTWALAVGLEKLMEK